MEWRTGEGVECCGCRVAVVEESVVVVVVVGEVCYAWRAAPGPALFYETRGGHDAWCAARGALLVLRNAGSRAVSRCWADASCLARGAMHSLVHLGCSRFFLAFGSCMGWWSGMCEMKGAWLA